MNGMVTTQVQEAKLSLG